MENRLSQDSSKHPRDTEVRGVKMKRRPMFDETGTTLLNGVKLSFEKGFGFNQNPDIKNTAHCIDDNRIIYLLSSQIVIYDMLAQTQKVIASFDADEEVGAMLYFKNIMLEDNIIFALHNPNKSFPSLTVMNFSKNFSQKIMLANLQKEEKVIELVLLNDYRNIATVSRMDKIVRLSIIEIISKDIKYSEYLAFNPIGMYPIPQAPTKLLMHTASEIYLTDIQDNLRIAPLGIRKNFELENNENIVQISNSLHAEFCLYVITDQGNLYFIFLDFKEPAVGRVQKYFLGHYQTLDEKGVEVTRRKRPSAICANEYNIAIGYESIQQFTLVKICAVSTQAPLIESISFSCPFLHKIVRMTFAAETMAICVVVQVKQNDKYDFSIPIQSQFEKLKGDNKTVRQNLSNHLLAPGKVFPIIFNLLLYDTLVETLRSPVQTVLNSMLLTKKILDICVLPTKKLVLVLSADKRIKAIKYEHVSSISFDKMLTWQYIFNNSDQPTSLDVHPLTFVVAVGFKEGLKFYNIFSQGMKTTNLSFQIKNCECVRYSRFGHLLLAGSSTHLMVINPYENIIKQSILLSHGYSIKELSFIDRDNYIFASYTNGSSQVLNLEGNKMFQLWNKSLKCITATYDPVFDIMIISFDDHVVRFYQNRRQNQFTFIWVFPFFITKLLLVNELGTLFMGTSAGKIEAYQWPITDSSKFSKYKTELQLHTTPIIQIKITHDYNYLITGAEDGTIFISKITPYSDGMVVSDSSILHTFKVNKKNYTSLYYLQPFMCTNGSIESQKQQQISKYQSDKAEASSGNTEELQGLQITREVEYRDLQQYNKEQLIKQIQPLQKQVEDINHRKVALKDELNEFYESWKNQTQQMDEKKLNTMRQLYKQSDHLRIKLQFYTKQFSDEAHQMKQRYQKQFNIFKNQMQERQNMLTDDCNQVERELVENKKIHAALQQEQMDEGLIYKKKMIEQLDVELELAKHKGEDLRKVYNKSSHQIRTEQQKSKYFQQLSSELEVDIRNSKVKRDGLVKQIQQLGEMLKQKDKQIFNEQKAVKQLLKKSINNYSHEEYLKHKQDELIEKAKYLQKQIESLDDKYKMFQENFIEVSKETNDYVSNIENAYKSIQNLKQKEKNVKLKNYMRKYRDKESYSKIMQCFHECNSKAVFAEKVKKILNLGDVFNGQDKEQKLQTFVDKRDHLIDQVVNTNKLRKIDDTIRNTIKVKLNRETVNLTSQVNELRKQKKVLSVKIRDLQSCIKQLHTMLFQQKQNKDPNLSSLTDIVPVNISVIRSQNSKHSKPLPFQVYHQNKVLSQRSSTYSKLNSKSIMDEGSTQLPSIIKHNQSYAGSILEQSTLFGVEENDDEVAQ